VRRRSEVGQANFGQGNWRSGMLEYWETPGTAAVHPSFHHSSFHGRSWFVRSLGTKHIRTSVLRAKTPVRPASWRPAAPAAGRPVFRSSRCAVIIASTSTFGHHGTGERVTAPMSGRPRHQGATNGVIDLASVQLDSKFLGEFRSVTWHGEHESNAIDIPKST
jgi:hypothetical protein